MTYKQIAKTLNEKDIVYEGIIISKETGILKSMWGVLRAYYLEIKNKETEKSRKIKIGYGGVDASNPSMPIFYDITVQSIDFTEKGLEAILRVESETEGLLFSPHDISKGKLFLIPKEKFPK